MLGKLAVALLFVAAPALAEEPAPAANVPAAESQEFTTKKVCRTVEVAGSFIPRTTCVTKKVPVRKPAPEAQEATTQAGSADGASKKQ
jgi:hypothetical protein